MGRIGKTQVNSIRTRCIEINLQRAKPDEHFERFEPGRDAPLFDDLRAGLSQWTAANGARLKDHDPQMPAELANRDADVWRFLFSIADLAGGHWPKEARAAAKAITLNTLVEGVGEELRKALQRALKLARDHDWLTAKSLSWDKLNVDQIASGELRISSAGLCHLLKVVTNGQVDLTQAKLAKRLKPYDISPASIKVGGTGSQGDAGPVRDARTG